jgi:methylated-DNA-[protein]-cysteine S-methyltransferase
VTSTEHDLSHNLRHALAVDDADLARLQVRLADAAAADHTLDVSVRTVDSPVGMLLLAATETGLVRVAFEIEDHATVMQSLSDRISPRLLQHASRLDPVARQLDEYFGGTRTRFEVDLDWRLSSGFRSSVLHQLDRIGYGLTATYATVAELAGRPKAVRAVGTACATNPLPVVVPCHRVIRSDGGIGGYLGGVEAKQTLLALEAA